MPLNLLADTERQAELDNYISIKIKTGKEEKKDLEKKKKIFCWLKLWAGTQQRVLFLTLHHTRFPPQKVRITMGLPCSPKLVYLEGFISIFYFMNKPK